MWPLVGGLVSAGSSLLGSMLSSSSTQANVAAQNAAIAEQNRLNRENQSQINEQNVAFQREMFDRNTALQREFATHGVRWKVEDAVAAGLHPLYALGGSTQSFAPISVGSPYSSSAGSMPVGAGDTSIGRGLASAGQDIGRAINATRTQDERVAAVVTSQSLERGALENELLKSQIARNNAMANPPMSGNPYLIPGQTQSGSPVSAENFKRVEGPAGQPGSEPAAITDVGYARTPTGWSPVPSKDVKERIEDNIIQETLHAVRNNLLPLLSKGWWNPPSGVPIPEGKEWLFDGSEYRLVNKPKMWLDNPYIRFGIRR